MAVAEAGGFTGDFDDGYGKAFLAVLEALSPKRRHKAARAVNLIGFSPVEENAAKKLSAIKRQLSLRGIEARLIFGAPGTTVESIREASAAALNVILHEARGRAIAAWLRERLGQPSVSAPLADAWQGRDGWIDAIEAALFPLPAR